MGFLCLSIWYSELSREKHADFLGLLDHGSLSSGFPSFHFAANSVTVNILVNEVTQLSAF